MASPGLMATVSYGAAVVFPLLVLSQDVKLPQTTSGERLSDHDVKQIVEYVDRTRDRFEDQLDGALKNSRLRGPSGELDVAHYLDDLQENVAHLRERFTSDYAASKEAETVLRQCTDIDAFMKAHGDTLKGRSEWDAMTAGVTMLARAYRASFPLPEGAPVRRINDKEASKTASNLADHAERLKQQLNQETTVPKPQRDAVTKDVDTLAKQARVVKDRTADSKPSTAEMRQLLVLSSNVSGFMTTHPGLLPGTTAAWQTMVPELDALAQAHGLDTPIAR